ncbi:putative reverse transcriptase domain-containing protein [Tanacetum coccineum]
MGDWFSTKQLSLYKSVTFSALVTLLSRSEKKMTGKYCPRTRVQNLEAELWNLKVKPKTMQEAVEMATELMDKKVITIAERHAENKRKFENTSRNNQNQQQQNKRQNTGRAYTTGTGEKKPYGGSKPLCAKCNYHHDGPCRTYFIECGVSRTATRVNSPKLKNNKNCGNQVVNDRAMPKSEYSGGDVQGQTQTPMSSFVSTAFSSQMDITPSTLDHYYDVELADGRIIGLNTILRGCTLNLLNHPFNINLMPVELGSFDAIIGMDWLAKYQAIIVCAEKIVRCPVFLAHVTTNEVEDKSEKKRLEDVPIVQDFPEVFPEDMGRFYSNIDRNVELSPTEGSEKRLPKPLQEPDMAIRMSSVAEFGFDKCPAVFMDLMKSRPTTILNQKELHMSNRHWLEFSMITIMRFVITLERQNVIADAANRKDERSTDMCEIHNNSDIT